MNKAEDYLKKWCTRRYGDDFEPKFGNWGERNMVNFAEYFAAEQIKEAQDNYIDQLEAENRTLEVENKLIDPLRNFIRSKHLSSEWVEFLNDYILNKK